MNTQHDYLLPTFFLDYRQPALQRVLAEISEPEETDRDKAVALFYFVRDKILYDPYRIILEPEGFTASHVLECGYGFCVTKSALYAALLRGAGIPARLGYADVKNHLTSERLAKAMGTDIFHFHGYVEVYLDNRWIKATPVFNVELCERAGLHPLEFDGYEDSIFHPFSLSGSRHMEYVHDRGVRDDLPFEEIRDTFIQYYPQILDKEQRKNLIDGDFQSEACAGE